MIFNSATFSFVFLPLALVVYFALYWSYARTSRPFWLKSTNFALLVLSLLMYAWSEQALTIILLATTAIDYVCAEVIARDGRSSAAGARGLAPKGGRSRRQEAALAVSIVTNVASLAYFKYADLGLESLDAAAALFGFSAPLIEGSARVALPLGLSFYTLQSLSYTIDVYRGVVAPARSYTDFVCYVAMFPQLVAGPIVRYRDVERELRERRVSIQDFGEGARRVVHGLAKKLLIADTLALPVANIFAIPAAELTTSIAWTGALCGVLQIYFDVSGYSDIAIGLGRMLGFRFPENFDYPYAARSVTDFWRRWHISLSTWFRDYLYRGLGGGRGHGFRTYFNLAAVFTLSGLWHGPHWTFVIWGLSHGVFLVVERLGFGYWLSSKPRLVGQAYAMLVHTLTFVFFRSDSVAGACDFLAAMLGGGSSTPGLQPLRLYLANDSVIALLAGAGLSQPLVPWLTRLTRRLGDVTGAAGKLCSASASLLHLISMAVLLVLCAMALSSNTYQAFIYFKF